MTLDRTAANMMRMVRAIFTMKAKSPQSKLTPHDPEYWVLEILWNGPLPISEIGRRLHRSKPSMTALVDRLASNGRVRRVRNEKDLRVTLLKITGGGRRALADRRKEIRANIKRSLSRLCRKDATRLDAALEETLEIMSKPEVNVYANAQGNCAGRCGYDCKRRPKCAGRNSVQA